MLEADVEMLERIIGACTRMKFGSGLVSVFDEDGVRRQIAFDGRDVSILEEQVEALKTRLAAE